MRVTRLTMVHSRRWLCATLSLVLLAACSSDSSTATPSGPVVLSIADGDGQTATVGQAVSIGPAVRATRSGAAASGVTVTFVVASGGGSLSAASGVSDATGLARAGTWTLGTVSGTNALSATATGGSSLTFTATARAGNAATLTKVAGDAQTAIVGDVVSTRPSIRINDQFGNVVPGVAVSFAITQGGGTIGGATTGTATSGTDGIATVPAWTLGTAPGTNTLTASIGALPAATFTITTRAGAAASASKVAGDAQTGIVGQIVTTRPAVRVTDQFGNGIAGATVNFVVAANSGAITGATQITGADGLATLGAWTLGTVPGSQSVTAAVSGTNLITTFVATVSAGSPTTVTKVAGDAQIIASGSALLTLPAVKVADQFGNGISGVPVTFSVTQGGGSVTGAIQTTGADGTARASGWVLGNATGSNTLTATATGTGLTGNPAVFSATGITGPAAILAKLSGDNQTSVPSADLAQSLAVKLSDRFGNPIADRSVIFAVSSGGGTITGATPFTTAQGIATLGGWSLGPTVGTQTVTASVGTLNVVFTATALAALNPSLYAGTYTGTWINTTFGSTDVASATIVVNANSTVTVTASASGSVLGGGAVGPTTRTASYSSTTASFTGNVPEMGNITGTIVNSSTAGVANIEATGTNVPNTAIQRWTATGTISATQLQLNFSVFFTSGSTAVGTVTLTK